MTAPDEIIAALWPDATIGDWRFGPAARGQERSIVNASTSDVRNVLPWRPATVVAAAKRTSDDHSSLDRWRASIGSAALLTVGAGRRRWRLGALGGESLVTSVAHELGHPHARGIVMCGPPRANRKPVVQLHDRFGRTIAFVKVAFNPLTHRLLAAEHASLDHLASIRERGFVTPAVLGRGSVGTAQWLALAPVGVDRRVQADQHSVDALAAAIERTAPAWDGPARSSSFVARVAQQSRGLAAAAPIVQALHDRDVELHLVTAAAHGDFVPWNVLTGRPVPAVWDWERYERDVPLGFDRLHHRIQVAIRHGRTPLPVAVRDVATALDRILPDVAADARMAHLDWYLAQMLCRYESDIREVATPRLEHLISDITSVLKERLP